jgi:hypothetical protein
VGEGVDVLLPAAVEVALEEQVPVAKALGRLPLIMRKALEDRPAREVDERQLDQRAVRVGEPPLEEEDDRQNEPRAPLQGAEDRDRDRLALDVARRGTGGRQRTL